MHSLSAAGPSVDTVQVLVSLVPGTDLTQHLQFSKLTAYYDLVTQTDRTYSTFFLVTLEELDGLSSSWAPPTIAVYGTDFVLQFSVPKILYGHSARLGFDLAGLLRAWFEYFRFIGLPVAASWENWRVRRVDISYNFELSSKADVKNAYAQLGRLRFLGKNAITKGRKQLAYWPGEARTIKFYAKGEEMVRNHKDYPDGFVHRHLEYLNCILRYEEEWRPTFLKRRLGVESTSELTVFRLLRYFETFDVEKHLSWVQSSFGSRGPAVDLAEVRTRIRAHSQKPDALERFVDQLLTYGVEICKQRYAKSTYYYLAAQLKKLKYDPSFFSTQFDGELGKKPLIVDLSEVFSSQNIAYGMCFTVCDTDTLNSRIRHLYCEIAEQNATLGNCQIAA